eukprot:TRINITY_DN111659_c0_g1_i1.p1 TRINITY_DN111659_c0_g1~~TRINITY_DN111659_c0_g1_i1.p1  ORF type:complete len:336 (-),score=68.50 TRINITY_DN111659_c0_g1_i1:218-1225(-)
MVSCRGCTSVALAAALVPVAVLMAIIFEEPEVTTLGVPGQGLNAEAETVAAAAAEASAGTGGAAPKTEGDVRLGSGGMFDRIAFAYDYTNRIMSLGLDQRWRRHVIHECMGLQKGDHVLDLATGTADVSILAGERLQELANGSNALDGIAVLGLDASSEMLRHGVVKVQGKGLSGVVRLVKGDAQDLSAVRDIDAAGTLAQPSTGVASDSVDKVSIAFGIRNVPDRAKALREMNRVLRKRATSRACILEVSLPHGQTLLSRLSRAFIQQVVPAIGWIATMGSGGDEYKYLERSIMEFPSPPDFAKAMGKEGLPVHSITSFAFGAINVYAASPSQA